MKARLLITVLSLACLAATGQEWRIHIDEPGPDGRPYQMQQQPHRTGDTIPAGWVLMTTAELNAYKASKASEVSAWLEVARTRPTRQEQAVRLLQERLESAGGPLKELRVMEAQCEMLRGLWRMVNASALTNRLTAGQLARMDDNNSKLARVLNWIKDTKDAIQNIATNAAAIQPSLGDPGELAP